MTTLTLNQVEQRIEAVVKHIQKHDSASEEVEGMLTEIMNDIDDVKRGDVSQ